ncbi:MAG: hypothetical protein HY275_12460 [Gemmatimonadetes bacterium]|nr:hypothetical protein [Gemmatimonadota bacterium]
MEDIIIPIAGIMFIPTCLAVWFWGKGYLRKIEQRDRQPSISPDILLRLERMEQGIDAIAVEVERISEGQRFTTRLLSERGTPAALPSSREGGA